MVCEIDIVSIYINMNTSTCYGLVCNEVWICRVANIQHKKSPISVCNICNISNNLNIVNLSTTIVMMNFSRIVRITYIYNL